MTSFLYSQAQTGQCLTKFSSNILMDRDRAFAFVGGPKKKDMIRHRAKYASVHPHYTVISSLLPLTLPPPPIHPLWLKTAKNVSYGFKLYFGDFNFWAHFLQSILSDI